MKSKNRREKIPIHIINLNHRIDRRSNIRKEFSKRSQFDIHFIEPVSNGNAKVSLWYTILFLVKSALDSGKDYIIICEDDHQFTKDYSFDVFINSLDEAARLKADVLLGGASSINSVFQVSDRLLWVESFTGLQFTVLFNQIFSIVLEAKFESNDCADIKLSKLSEKIFLIFPFISVQKDFGYSDVTELNNNERRVESLFLDSKRAIDYVLDLQNFYGFIDTVDNNIQTFDYLLTVHVINYNNRSHKSNPIVGQFIEKSEFDVVYYNLLDEKRYENSIWLNIKEAIQSAIDQDEDIVIICDVDHIFTCFYRKEVLIQNILEAHLQGCDILCGGIGNEFSHALPVTKNRYWINQFITTNFFVVYKKIFQRIIETPFDNMKTYRESISHITANKMVIFPFISESSSPKIAENPSEKEDVSAWKRFQKVGQAARNYLNLI